MCIRDSASATGGGPRQADLRHWCAASDSSTTPIWFGTLREGMEARALPPARPGQRGRRATRPALGRPASRADWPAPWRLS
eukprot:34897-Lingulodinium_polyedra.AAC.1